MRVFIHFSKLTDDKAVWEKFLMVLKNGDERRHKKENVKGRVWLSSGPTKYGCW